MIQFYFNTKAINASQWEIAYEGIKKIIQSSPVLLLRLESYKGFQSNLNKLHTELETDIGLDTEAIAFSLDQITFKGGPSFKCYKNWDVQCTQGFGNRLDFILEENKSIYWSAVSNETFTGELPKSNGYEYFSSYFEENGIYYWIVVAIGIFLENLFDSQVFIVIYEADRELVFKTKMWVESIFNRNLDMPIYCEIDAMAHAIEQCYESKIECIGRLEDLYPRFFEQNMLFSINRFGYKETLQYYAGLLSTSYFMTFGFCEILDAWMTVTTDLEKTLELVSLSEKLYLENMSNQPLENVRLYDYGVLLKKLLNNGILWSQKDRDRLYLLKEFQNQQDDLSKSMMRISGLHINFCPLYADKNTLFEQFMYQKPLEAASFLAIINEWNHEVNIQKLKELEHEINKYQEGNEFSFQDSADVQHNEIRLLLFLNDYPKESHFILEKIIKRHPYMLDLDACMMRFVEYFKKIYATDEGKKAVINFFEISTEFKLKNINRIIKEKHLNFTVGVCFFDKIKDVDDRMLTNLYFIMATKIFDKELNFARNHLIFDDRYWHYLASDGGIVNFI